MNTRIQPALAAMLFLCLNTVGTRAATIVGKVQVGPTGLGASVVYLEGVKGKFDPPTKSVVIDQQDKVFIPHVVAVMKGGTVEFRNSDDFLHNTFSQSKSKTFDLHQPVKGSRSLLKTDEAGVIEVRCHIHGSMQAWIVVVDNPYFAVTDQKGLFRIAGVPPGTYKIKSWSEQHGFLTQEVKVTEKEGATVILKYAGK
jgi:plastocyanin